jgi:molybdenum cofactor guanylyltransferase
VINPNSAGMKTPPKASIGVCILAGGLSQRMGRDKAHLRLGGSTLLSLIRRTARQLGFPVRTIRRDLVRRSGPLGGIYTGLITSHADVELFLGCDMPFIRPSLLKQLISAYRKMGHSVFVQNNDVACLPLLLPRDALDVVEQQIKRKQLSLQSLATALSVHFVKPGPRAAGQLLNINTPADWANARNQWKKRN